jgi:hypothetical protein
MLYLAPGTVDACAASSILPFAVTPSIHGFRPSGLHYELRSVIRHSKIDAFCYSMLKWSAVH